MTPTVRATPAQLEHDAKVAEQLARLHPKFKTELLAMARRRRVLAYALDVGGAPHTSV